MPHLRHGLLVVVLASSNLACSLLAPSDADLMGGATHDAAGDAGDAGDGGGHDGGATDASVEGGSDAACLPVGAFCNGMPAQCCSGTCNAAAGKKCD